MTRVRLLAPAVAVLLWQTALAGDLDGIRGPTPLTAEPGAAAAPKRIIADQPQPRGFPDQPPITPHAVRDDYKFESRKSRCVFCHNRMVSARIAGGTHAPTITVSHFIGRDGRMATEVTPGHRFCASCHVTQAEISPPIDNTFRGIGGKPR